MMKRCQNQTRVEEWEAMTNMIELEQANARILCPSRGLLLLGKVQVTQDPLKFEEEKEQPKSAWTHFLGSHSTASLASSTDSSVCSGIFRDSVVSGELIRPCRLHWVHSA